jgi:hypothetical protein
MPQDETFELGGRGERLFPVRGLPQRLERGDTVFFSHRGKIVGRSKLIDVRPVPVSDRMEYLEQGSPRNRALYHYLCVGSIKPIRGGPAYVGRVGIRYVDNLRDKILTKRLRDLIL